MGVYISIAGIAPPDGTYHRMKDVWFACEKAGMDIPDQVLEYFDHTTPDENGIVTYISDRDNAITEYNGESCNGYDVELSKLDPKFKILRVTLS